MKQTSFLHELISSPAMAAISLRNLKRNRTRTVLSALGIIIGVFAICSLGMAGTAFTISINDMIDENANMLMLSSESEQDGSTESSFIPRLSDDDVNRIERAIKAVTPDYRLVRVHYGTKAIEIGHDEMLATLLFGEKENTDILVGGTLAQGKLPRMDTDVVILSGFAEKHNLKVGSHIKTTNKGGETVTLRVTGIIDDTLLSRVFSITMSPNILLCTSGLYSPLTGAEGGHYRYVLIKIEDIHMVPPVVNAIDRAMNGKADKITDNKVEILNITDLMTELRNILSMAMILCVAISAVALLVASISIMNIMIIAVQERTHEIGLMRAIGTFRRQIVCIFLYEAAFIGFFGAAAGVLLSCISVAFLLNLLSDSLSVMLLPSVWIYIPISMAIGVGVCVISGLYPAIKAALMNPIEAMAKAR